MVARSKKEVKAVMLEPRKRSQRKNKRKIKRRVERSKRMLLHQQRKHLQRRRREL